jgi:hypothetical protein
MTKCFCYVKDNDTHRFRKCKSNAKFVIEGHNYCYIHTKQLFNKHAVVIQKLWRSYRTRTKINNLYINLPTELQQQVLQHLTANANFNIKYDKQFVPLINAILSNKYKRDNIARVNIRRLYNKYYDILDEYNLYICDKTINSRYYYSMNYNHLLHTIWNSQY